MSADVLPFPYIESISVKDEPRNEEPKTRSVILPVYLWEILDNDAKRCRRSAAKQIEAILVRYYGIELNVDLDEEALTTVTPETVSQKPRLKKTA